MSAGLIALVTLIYLGVAVSEWIGGRRAMAFVWFGYALANIGLIAETLK